MQKTLLESIDENLKKVRYTSLPFNHWIYERVFPDNIVDELLKLPFQAPKIDHYTGKRESNNLF